MTISEQYKGKYFFHFTHLENLEEILANGLLSTNEKEKKNIEHLNVASSDIQCTRHEMKVTCGPKGHVHDYVPFYFNPRTPMFLSLIKSRNYDQPYFIYFAVSINNLENEKFVFTDKAANRRYEPPTFYDCPSKLDELSWSCIESKAWSSPNEAEKHKKMAEALHFKKFELSDISYIIVWNEDCKEYVENSFKKSGIKCPPVFFDGENGYHHYYCDFNYDKNSSLVQGPEVTRSTFERIVKSINKARKTVDTPYQFDDIEEALCAIRKDFSCIKELKGIVDLPTDNRVHSENVEGHTRRVVKNLVESSEYENLDDQEKLVVEFAAYLHDVGKGPKSRWTNGKQKVDDDHPRKSALYIERVLAEEIDSISKKEIRQVVLLVMYHDFFGDHLTSGRFLKELNKVLKTESDLNMLYALAKADVMSIHSPWYTDRVLDWEKAHTKIMEIF
ncbi:DarT ssDNA thymidine ADP-ribosyltransferase family protein [Pelagibaculum spongiae]|uniref:DUF4433 domain-containing protein n=1 Tax=Pelagibaculum spongiae TaxID=2080658 RepID=A0A2V1GUX2_9GAMM|nr:DarT ssDNA thymidine ADP-ribosyltransferase family protein [Pelagibaculum spongiae]PVZ66698.1 DUF4433 domain-containing protein [Pelagibaculum spongiae]